MAGYIGSSGAITLSGIAIGEVVAGGTPGEVLFVDGSGNLGQDAGLTYDPVTNTLSADNAQFKGRPWFDVRAYGATGDGTTDDTVAIQAALNAVSLTPGGCVFFPAGTAYKITSTLTLPATNITLYSPSTTVINIGSNAIAAFTYAAGAAFTVNILAQGLNIKGDGSTVGQKAFDVHDTGSAGVNLILTDTVINGIEIGVYDRGILGVYVNGTSGSGMSVNATSTSYFYTGPIGNSGLGQLFATDAYFLSVTPASGGGGIANKPTVYAKNCIFQCHNGIDAEDLNLFGCVFSLSNGASVNVTYAGTATNIVACRFTNNHTVVANGASGFITSTLFLGTNPTRNLDIGAGASGTKVCNCHFAGGTSQAVRTASITGKFSNCIGLKVLETGAADSNEYVGNAGMSASTIIGASSLVITSSVNMGVNTLSPARKVDITDPTNPQLRVSYDGTKYGELQADSSGFLRFIASGGVYKLTTGNAFRTGSAGDTFFFDLGDVTFRDGDGTGSGADITIDGKLTVANAIIKVTSAQALRTGAPGDTYFFDVGAVTFRDGDGSGGSFKIDANKTLIPQVSLAVGMTTGFINIPGAAGAPVGTPASTTGFPLYYDKAAQKLYIYDGGWKKGQVGGIDVIYA
jgi:hypothetical protein